MIRRKVSKQLTNLTYRLKVDKKNGMIIKLEVLQFTNFTYVLETEGDWIGWLDEKYSNN